MVDPGLDLEKQIVYFRSKHELNPRSRIFAPLADLYRRVGRLDEALRLLEDGLKIHPEYVSALVILGRTQLDAGDRDLARTTLQKVMALDSENLVVLKLLASDAQEREAWQVARQLYERVVQLDTDDTDAKDRIKRLGRRDGSLPRAHGTTVSLGQHDDPGHVSGFRDVDLDTDSTDAADAADAADVGSDAGEAIGAGSDVAESAMTDPPAESPLPLPGSDPVDAMSAMQGLATKTLADIYIAQGYRDKARVVLERILEQQPDRDDVRARLDELDTAPSPDPGPPIDPVDGGSFSPTGTVISPRRRSENHALERKQFAEWLRRIKQQQEED